MSPHARVIVSAYNQLPCLRLTLRGYLRQTTNDFSLVIADDGSRPDTREFLQKIAPEFEERGIPFKHVWQEDRGWRRCRILNEGVRRVSGDETLLIFCDGDCIPPAHFVATHIEVHEPRSFHVAGAYRLSREVSDGMTESDVDSGKFEGFGTAEQQKYLRKRRRKSRWGTLMRRRHRPKILGLNMAFDRELLEEVNGFDERIEHYSIGEDTDVRDRLMRLRPRPRVKVLYTKNDVYHLWHGHGEASQSTRRAFYGQQRPVRCVVGLVQPT